MQLTFLVVRVPSIYNAILNRSGLNTLKAIISTYYLLVYFLTKKGIGEIRGDQMVARQYFMIFAKIKQPVETMPTDIPDVLDELEKVRDELTEKLEAIPLKNGPGKMIQIGINLKIWFKG